MKSLIIIFTLSFGAMASYLETCNFNANINKCEKELCDIELLSMKMQPGSHGDYRCKRLMKKGNISIKIKPKNPSDSKIKLNYFYANSRGAGQMNETEKWKEID